MIHMILALRCEAYPLITHYRLKKAGNAHAFPIYLDQAQQISLTITGVGKINAAAATAFTHAFLSPDTPSIWLNVGIAGCQNLAIGNLAIAHKIIDHATQRAWYPQIVFHPPCRSRVVQTHDTPITDGAAMHPQDTLLEMEAAGFFATACRFATAEFIHVIKIVSDNQAHAATDISASLAGDLVASQLPNIAQIITALIALIAELEQPVLDPRGYDNIIRTWRFTHAERQLLRICLRRWQLLCLDQCPITEVSDADHAQEVIKRLARALDQHPIQF